MQSRKFLGRRARLSVAALLVLAVATTIGVSPGFAKNHRGGDRLGKINHIVVIYEENHSFDNLYGKWEGVNGLRKADAAHTKQVKEDGTTFHCLPQDDVNLTAPPLSDRCQDTNSTDGQTFHSHFFNKRRHKTNDGNPFQIDNYIPPSAKTCPAPEVFGPANGIQDPNGLPGGCTRDLVHRYYQEQYQLHNGKQDRYTTGSDALGLTQGVYDTRKLPIYRYLHRGDHPHYAISDDFFQGAFGGSFLNHQWLIAARTPFWQGAPTTVDPQTGLPNGDNLHSVADTNGMPNNYPHYKSTNAVKDQQLTESCPSTPANHDSPPRDPAHNNAVCGDWAVNTTQPPYQPYSPGTASSRQLPPQTSPTIGDRLNHAGRSWAWYSGGWSNADARQGEPGWTNGEHAVTRTNPHPSSNPPGPSDTNNNGCPDPNANWKATWPNCPDNLFQFHHQPFNYFQAYAPGTQNRKQHLRDEAEFIHAAQSSKKSCKLRDVSFVKPIGAENEHPGYASEPNGSDHLVDLLKAIEGGKCRKDTMVVVTYDEFGGGWDHVPPPGQGGTAGPHDAWGPGTRVPALTIAPGLRGDFVADHRQHDTTSVLSTIEHRYGLAPLGSRDAAAPDMSSVFAAKKTGSRGRHGRRHRR